MATIKDVFGKKYGKDFVSAAVDLRPNSGVNRMVLLQISHYLSKILRVSLCAVENLLQLRHVRLVILLKLLFLFVIW